MPLFYFDVREGSCFISDADGIELHDLDAAEREAAEAAAELGRERLSFSKDRSIVIEVRNEHGQRILTATVSLQIVRVKPTPSWHPTAI
jgi:hypothetical protein